MTCYVHKVESPIFAPVNIGEMEVLPRSLLPENRFSGGPTTLWMLSNKTLGLIVIYPTRFLNLHILRPRFRFISRISFSKPLL